MKYFIMKYFILNVTILLSLCLLGCTSQRKVAYFYDVNKESAEAINEIFNTVHEARVVPGDMLSIVISGLDPTAVAPFNLPVVAYARPGSEQLYANPSLQAYLVDINGDINFPIVGKIHLAGLKKSEAIEQIKVELSEHLKDIVVTIQFLNYKITVLGEVNRPGVYSIDNERVTIIDALGLAGDMSIYGKRPNVLVGRENNGKMEFCRLNLNTDEIFTSPYYYLQQNDFIYVEPNNMRALTSQNIPLYLSTVSTLASMATVIISVTKK
jgi:polysaccharide export outer membrane protein